MFSCLEFPLGTQNCYAVTNFKGLCAQTWDRLGWPQNNSACSIVLWPYEIFCKDYYHVQWGNSRIPLEIKKKILLNKKMIIRSWNHSQSCIKVKHWSCLTGAPKTPPKNKCLQSCRTAHSKPSCKVTMIFWDVNSRRKSWIVFLTCFWA